MPYSAIRAHSERSKVVLYADDSADDIVIFKRAALRIKCNLDLHFVPNGAEAIAWLAGEEPYSDRTRFPLPDVLMTDLKMPKRSGMDVLVWVRSHPVLMKLPVIVYTTSILPEEKAAAQRLGATKFITKTTHCNEILATLAHCLNCSLLEPVCFSRCPGSNPKNLVR